MNIKTMRVHLKGISDILGGMALNVETYQSYIAKNAREDHEVKEVVKDEVVNTGKTEREVAREDAKNVVEGEDQELKVTGFYRDEQTGNLILKGYQIKGFFKAAAQAIKDQIKLSACTSRIDNYLFIQESNIPLMRDGKPIENPDGYLERPLRASTAQGPRVALAKSEMVKAGWELEFTIKIVEHNGTKQSKAIDEEMVKEMLAYGELKGLLQWRNGGYGSFTYEVVE